MCGWPQSNNIDSNSSGFSFPKSCRAGLVIRSVYLGTLWLGAASVAGSASGFVAGPACRAAFVIGRDRDLSACLCIDSAGVSAHVCVGLGVHGAGGKGT